MGNCNSVSSSESDEEPRYPTRDLPPIPGLEDLVDRVKEEEEGMKDVEVALKDFKESNLERMREELRGDLNTFILNNLLLTIQFFDNFDTALESAKAFKFEKETEMNSKLNDIINDGVIFGERRVALVHGMGSELAKNFVYKPTTNSIDDFDVIYKAINRTDINHTFMTNALLPLDFYISWDNLEVFKESDWDSLQNSEYSSTEAPNLRFCIEEPSNENQIPKGYVRFRCMDIPQSLSTKLASMDGSKPDKLDNYDYTSNYNYDLRNSNDQEISEADTTDEEEEEESSPSSEDDENNSEEGAISDSSNAVFLKEVRNATSLFKNSKRSPPPIPEATPSPPTYSVPNKGKSLLLSKKLSFSDSNLPQVIVQSPTSPMNPKGGPFGRRDSGVIPRSQIKTNSTHTYTAPLTLAERIKSKSTPKLPTLPNDIVRISNTSSGYETISQRSQFTISSSAITEEIRERWRELEIKQLWEFPSKVRPKSLTLPGSKPEPLSNDCFLPVQIEDSSDDEPEDEDSDDFNSETDSIDSRGVKIKRNLEPTFKIRTYLNSSIFSSDFCSEFRIIARKLKLPASAISQATVFGTTLRLSLTQGSSDELYDILYTFTPCLKSEFWPQKSLIWWKHRMRSNALKKSEIEGLVWPKPIEVESIVELGCNATPIGFRKMEIFNKFQSIEWQVNFPHAETLLLNSFKAPHWRTYIYSSILFRAFIAPLGPLGIDLSHLRNVLYFMCEENFVDFKDEEPGSQLKSLLSRVYNCLAKGGMPHFFNKPRNLLGSIPPQNILKVQAYLHRIRTNLIIYCIYAFRNLHCLRPEDKFYPKPDLLELYKLLTVSKETDLFYILSPFLKPTEQKQPEIGSKGTIRKQRIKRYRSSRKKAPKDEEGEDLEFRRVREKPIIKDKYWRRTHKRYERYVQDNRNKREEEKRRKRLEEEAKEIIPVQERRRSIDLEEAPIKPQKFTPLRKVLVIDYFIRHFIKMAQKSYEFKIYSQATMYVLHIENLCELLGSLNLNQTPVDEWKIEGYLKQVGELKNKIGINKKDYVISKISHLELPGGQDKFLGIDLNSNVDGDGSKSNWELRKLPTPPVSNQGSISSFHGLSEGLSGSTSWGKQFPQMKRLPRPHISVPHSNEEVTRRMSIKFLNEAFFSTKSPYKKPPSTLNEESSIDSSQNFRLEKKFNTSEWTKL